MIKYCKVFVKIIKDLIVTKRHKLYGEFNLYIETQCRKQSGGEMVREKRNGVRQPHDLFASVN